MVEHLFSKTKPQCVGIYRVDVPESFKNGTNKATYDDFKIESQFIYPPAFKQRIELREQELNEAMSRPENKPENAPFIKEIIRLPDNQGVIFDSNKSGSQDAYRMLEAHVYVNHIAFIITTKIRDLSASKYTDERKSYLEAGFTEIELNDKPVKLAAMRSLISRLQGRLDHDIPTDKGWCIPNGFIADDGGKHKVVVGFSYENDDFLLGINSDNTMIADGDTLFGRSGDINDALKDSYMKSLKKEALMLNDIPAETWLFGGIQTYRQKTLQVYDFLLYANEAVATTVKPLITIGINSEYKQTRYSEAQMVEIWDRIVGSLRYKPNAF
ncbi:T6SS immunity protein Tli4 family protein [Providencia heimbachae]|uniref:T6SS immunity protein Tli4 family protein n=2 Tax=Providencia heimbachae TaxID=333962 RepID=UPI001E62A76A|nr:T6SS immunity protein Tli4 family protein [Providencia heimbachae]